MWSRNFIALFIVQIMVQFGFNFVSPNITPFARSIGVDSALLGFIVSAASVCSLLTRPFSGLIADRCNRRDIMLVTQAGLALTFCLYGLCQRVPVLLTARVLHGVLSGLNATLGTTLVVDMLPQNRMASGIGIYSLSALMTIAVAPAVGIEVIGRFGYRVAFFTVAALNLCTLLFFYFAFDAQHLPTHPAPPAKSDEKRGLGAFLAGLVAVQALPSALIIVCNNCASQGVHSFIVLFGEDRGIERIALYFTVYSAMMLISRPIMGRLSDRLPFAWIILPCCAAIALGTFLLSGATSLAAVLAGSVFMGLGLSGSGPMLQVYALRLAPAWRRGAASATYYMGMDVGSTLGPILSGWLVAHFGYRTAFAVLSLSPLLGIGVMLLSLAPAARWQAERAAETQA